MVAAKIPSSSALDSESEISSCSLTGVDIFSELYEQHAQAALDLARRLTGDRSLAEDAFQEAMLRIWRASSPFRQGNMRAWVRRIVARECIRALQSRQCEKRRIHTALSVGNLRQMSTSFEGAESEHVSSILDRVLLTIPNEQRNLLNLYFQARLSQREIGALLGIPQQTIMYRLKKAINSLRRGLSSK